MEVRQRLWLCVGLGVLQGMWLGLLQCWWLELLQCLWWWMLRLEMLPLGMIGDDKRPGIPRFLKDLKLSGLWDAEWKHGQAV